MVQALLLRFDAPLMAFGGATVDQYGVTRDFPSASMITGLLANALGWHRQDGDRLNDLQSRVRFAARCDVPGQHLRDFQTVDLGQPFMVGKMVGWTTRGFVEGRGGGSAKTGTHIRYRDYLVDAVYTVGFTLAPPEPSPTLDEFAEALRRPARPLFLGRKGCVPASPVLLGAGAVRATGVLEAVMEAAPASLMGRGHVEGQKRAWWPADEVLPEGVDPAMTRRFTVCDERDWVNQIHAGRRFVCEGLIGLPEPGVARG